MQSPCPFWLTTNAGRLGNDAAGMGGSDFALRRAGRVADGWMTHSVTPDGLRRSWSVIEAERAASGRDMAGFGDIVTAVLNIQDDADDAMSDAKRCLDMYCGANYSPERLHAWGPIGTQDHCAAWIRRFNDTPCLGFTFRLATMGDAMGQLRRLTEDVLPGVT